MHFSENRLRLHLQGIISAVLVYLGTDLGGKETTSSEKEAITALCSAGAFIGAIIAGLTADQYGRKIAIYVGCVLFTVGAILQGAAYSIGQMVSFMRSKFSLSVEA